MAITTEERIDQLELRMNLWESSNAQHEKRVSELEQILGMFIVHTERALIELKQEMKDFKNEMKDFKNEMKDFKNEMKDFKNEMKDFKNEMKDFKNEMSRSHKEMNKKWGDLVNRMGTMVEDIVAPSIPKIATDVFGCGEIQDFMVRRWKRKPADSSKRREFDVLAICDDKIVFVEVKETPRQSYLEDFAEFIKQGEFFEYFPEYKDKLLVPVFGSLYLSDEAVNFLSNRKIFAMTMNDNVVQIVNKDAIIRKTSG